MRTPPRVIPALLTPFTNTGDIDHDAHRHNLRTMVERGISGFLLGGSTGEGPYLEAGERARLLHSSRDELGRDSFLVCGVAGESVRLANHQVEEAVAGSADAALVLTPTSLVRGNHEAVARFYRTVAEAAEIPIMLYSVPRVTGYELPPDVVIELAHHPNVAGIKDSGGRPVRIKEIAREVPADFYVFAGASPALAASMAAGGYGAITASCNYATELVSAIVTMHAESPSEADRYQEQLTTLVRIVEARGLPGTKAAGEATGLKAGHPRAPLERLEIEDAPELLEAVGSPFGQPAQV